MTFLLFLFIALGFPSFVFAAQCTFTWTAPATNTDGTPTTDLKGYRLKSGTAPGGPYTLVQEVAAPATTAALNCNERTVWVVTAIDTENPPNESAPSNEVYISDRTAPLAPGNLRVTVVHVESGG